MGIGEGVSPPLTPPWGGEQTKAGEQTNGGEHSLSAVRRICSGCGVKGVGSGGEGVDLTIRRELGEERGSSYSLRNPYVYADSMMSP
jgi:hypothetical protein